MIFSVFLPLEFLPRTGCGAAHFLSKSLGSIYTGRAGCPFISVWVTIPQMAVMLCARGWTGFNVRRDRPHSGARTSGQMSQQAICSRRHSASHRPSWGCKSSLLAFCQGLNTRRLFQRTILSVKKHKSRKTDYKNLSEMKNNEEKNQILQNEKNTVILTI